VNDPPPLARWFPPKEWKVGVHTKHLYNLYIYFWRWATWKVFGDPAATSAIEPHKGIVCFITVAGFLQGPGFEAMRADLRRTADEIWVIDCSPEGHQPVVSTRIFQGVQQPVCILMVARSGKTPLTTPARVKFRSLPAGNREGKFAALAEITLDGNEWEKCSSDWRASFLPAATGGWATYPTLETLFGYNSSGLKAGRTWPIAPDRDSLEKRWSRLIDEKNPVEKEKLFHPQLRHGVLAARHVNKIVREHLGSIQTPAVSIAKAAGKLNKTVRFGFRSFDRQWLIADARLINDPRPELWYKHSPKQVYMTALLLVAPTSGPAVTFTAEIPDQHHYKGSFGGRVFPLWADAAASETNIHPAVLDLMKKAHGKAVTGEDVYAYIATITAHPGYISRFASDLKQPGLRVPITGDVAVFDKAVKLGREVIWLHTFGDRYTSTVTADGRPAGPARMPKGAAPQVPVKGAISALEDDMPQELRYDAAAERLYIGTGHIDHVSPAVWAYEVSGKPVLEHWFGYRGLDRNRPIIGERREPSSLGDIQPSGWLAEYTTELLNVINILGRLVLLEPKQQAVLEEICDGTIITADELAARL
jgi:predicted helicase